MEKGEERIRTWTETLISPHAKCLPEWLALNVILWFFSLLDAAILNAFKAI